MKYEVRLHPDAVKFLKSLDSKTIERIKAAIKNIADDPYKSRSKADIVKLKGTKGRDDLYRLRVGNYRVIYAVESSSSIIWVTEIIERGKGYQWL